MIVLTDIIQRKPEWQATRPERAMENMVGEPGRKGKQDT
jgi:hypothetical protein